MKINFKRLVSLTLVLMLVMSIAIGCTSNNEEGKDGAETFPTKPIEVIAPSAAGGGTDLTARALADVAKDELGQGIGILNKPGGSGSVGMTEGASAKADGYTVTMVFVELALYEHLGISPLTPDEFKALGMINLDPAALTVPIDAPYDTVEEFIEYAKAHPGELSVGNSGTGSIWHIAAASIEKGAGIELNHVPHEGATPAVTALVGGHIDAVTVSPAEVRAQIEAGNLKTLVVMGDERSALLPDVPTFKELNIDVQNVGTWRGLMVPKDTPDDVANKLEETFLNAAKSEKFVEFMETNGLGIEIKSSEEFEEFIKENQKTYGEIISELDLGQ